MNVRLNCKIIIGRKIVNSHGIGYNVMKAWAKVIAANESLRQNKRTGLGTKHVRREEGKNQE